MRAWLVAAMACGIGIGCDRGRAAPDAAAPAHGNGLTIDDAAAKGIAARGNGLTIDDAAAKGADAHSNGLTIGADAGGRLAVITLAPEAVRAAGLRLEEAKRRPLGSGLRASARITVTQQGVARVAPRVAGRLVTIAVDLGTLVKKGAELGVIESPELGTLRAEYRSAVTKLEVARDEHEREQRLYGKGISSARELRSAEGTLAAARADRDAIDARLHTLGLSEAEITAFKRDTHYRARFPLRAPIAGTVTEIAGSVGESVDATRPLFTVAELGRLWALLDVYESQLPLVRRGQEVDLVVGAVPGRHFRGHIDYIGDTVDDKTRSVRVRVVVPNPDGLLKPGMFAQADISTTPGVAAAAAGVVVPREAVQRVGSDDVVFVQVGPSAFQPTRVRLGAVNADEAEVVAGLDDGARVVSRGAFVLKSELVRDTLGGP